MKIVTNPVAVSLLPDWVSGPNVAAHMADTDTPRTLLGSSMVLAILSNWPDTGHPLSEVVVSRETTVLPARDTATLDATESLLRSDGPVALSAAGGSVDLTPELRQLLADVVKTMRRGQAVTVAPLSQQLTTQQAADLLGISRPTLIKILEQGLIPFETPGRHRRLRLRDVLAFQEVRRSEQRQTLKQLTEEAQELGLYDVEPHTFEAALNEARRKHA